MHSLTISALWRPRGLHEDYPVWSWHQQIEEKSWCTDDHLRLADALIELFPPSLYCAWACPS